MERIRRKRNRKRRRVGVVLVVVLWVLVVLTVLTVALAQNTRLDNAVRIAGGDRVTARWLARAGVHRAAAEIAGDTSQTDWEGDSWYDNEELFQDVKLEGGTYRLCADRWYEDGTCAYGVMDEAGKINLNTASEEMLMALPEMTETLAGDILEWRAGRKELFPTEEPEMLGAGEDVVSFAAQGAMQTVRELGWAGDEATEEMLYREDRNLNGILENNENDGEETPPKDNQDDNLERGLLAYVTVYSYERNVDGQGRRRININTATREEMQEQLELHPVHTLWIVQNRPFTRSIADLLGDEEVVGSVENVAAVSAAIVEEVVAEGVVEEEEEQAVRPDIDTFRRIADRITITDQEVIPGRININTAGAVVLGALPEVNENLATAIIEGRDEQEEGYQSIAGLLTVPGMSVEQFKNVAALITVRSNVFTVRSFGRAERTGIEHRIEAVIERGQTRSRILYWKEQR